jgi:hydrogenase maturation protease
VLLIGYGNTLRGDDALGPIAVERLRPRLVDAECVSCHQLGPEVAERLAECDLVLFVDAAAEGDPGTVRVQRLAPETNQSTSLTHHVHPVTLLSLAKTLYGHVPEAMLVTGAGADFADGEGLSPHGRKAIDEICRLVPLLIRKIPI